MKERKWRKLGKLKKQRRSAGEPLVMKVRITFNNYFIILFKITRII